MKKLLAGACCAAVLCATPAFANTDGDDVKATPLTGPYIGVYGGYDWSDLEGGGVNVEPDGWDGGVFVGYRFDALMDFTKGIGIGGGAALEAFYGISNSDDTSGGIRAEKENEWGVSLRPGLSFFDSMTSGTGISPYAILGYRNTKFEGSGGALSGSDRYHGFELGAGTQLIAMGNVGLRLEYAHIWYNEDNGIDPDGDNLRLGLSMHF